MPIKKENEVIEKARLEMERMRHGTYISTDTMTNPNRVDDITTSTSEPWVKRLHPMDPTQVPTSKQSPTNNPSTRHVEALEDIGVLRDSEYEALDLGAMINLKSLQEDQNHVKHTPNMDHHVNAAPHQRRFGIHSSCPPSLPRLSSARKNNPRCIYVDESHLSGLEGKFQNALSIGNVLN